MNILLLTKILYQIFFFLGNKTRQKYTVPTFQADSHFDPCFILLLFQSLKTENQLYFGPCCQPTNRKLLRDRWRHSWHWRC